MRLSEAEIGERVSVRPDWKGWTQTKGRDSTTPTTLLKSQLEKALTEKGNELETAALDAIKINHHLKMCKEALKTNTPPKGLTPILNLTTQGQTSELEAAVKAELVKSGLEVCWLLKLHYITLMEQTNQKIGELQSAMNDISDSGSTTENETLKSICQKRFADISKKCEDKSQDLRKTFTRKRARDTEQPLPDTKKARITPTVLNTITEWVTAIQDPIKVVNEVGITPNQYYNTIIPPPPHTASLKPGKTAKPSPKRPRKRQKRRPSASTRMKLKRARHTKSYKKKLRNRNKLTKNNNIINLSSYALTNAEKSILSKGLSFIPKPKTIDSKDISIGLNRLRTQMCSQYEQAMKQKPTPPTVYTNYIKSGR